MVQYEKVDKLDTGKIQPMLVCSSVVEAIARVREYGLKKYPDTGKDGWRRLSIEQLQNACYRHWLLYVENPNGVDAESGLPHLWHVACNVMFLCERFKKDGDNRASDSQECNREIKSAGINTEGFT